MARKKLTEKQKAMNEYKRLRAHDDQQNVKNNYMKQRSGTQFARFSAINGLTGS